MLKNTEYAYAVSKIRVFEPSLLTAAETDRMTAAKDADEVLRVLADKGWDTENFRTATGLLRNEAEKSWAIIKEALPDKKELDFLIVENDFHNLKASLKALVSGNDAEKMFILPSIVPTDRIREAVFSKHFRELPDFLRDTAEKAYELLTSTSDGQLTDVFIDKAALAARCEMSRATGRGLLIDMGCLPADTANLRTAMRCAHTGKEEQFIRNALADCGRLDLNTLARAASRGTDELGQYISSVLGEEAAGAASSMASFEKYCDDLMIEKAREAKLISFGPEPVAAFWLARTAEIKTVRIILNCKSSGVSAAEISGRVRALYV